MRMSLTEHGAPANLAVHDGRPVSFAAGGIFTGGSVSADLALRLAQAAGGLAGRGPLYLVASYVPVDPLAGDPYDVRFAHDQNAATALADQLTASEGVTYGAFGPFDQPMVPTPGQLTLASLAIELSNGTVIDPETDPRFDPKDYDTLFWTVSSVRKFAMPYYASLYSPAYAQAVVDNFNSAEGALMVHMPWTEYAVFNNGGFEVEVFGGGDAKAPTSKTYYEIPVFLFPRVGTYVVRVLLPY
jgi:hypothetical protein